MNKQNNGGPAFPVPLNQGQSWNGMAPCDGMSLRDYFAGQALQGFLASSVCATAQEFAKLSFAAADAMLEERGE